MTPLLRFLKESDGTTAVEYAVMLALVIGAVITAIGSVGAGTGGMMGNNASTMQAAGLGS